MSKLARTISVILIVLTVLGVGGATAGMVLDVRSNAVSRAQVDLLSRAKVLSAFLADQIQKDVNAVAVIPRRPTFRHGVATAIWREDKPVLAELLQTHPQFSSVGVYDARGVLRFRLPVDRSVLGRRFAKQDYFSKVRQLKKPYVSKLYVGLGRPKGVVLAYASPIIYRTKFRGVVVATVSVRSFDTFVAPSAPLDGDARLYDQAGELISPSSKASPSPPSNPAVAGALRGRRGVFRDGGSLVAVSPVGETGWAAAVSQPMRTIDRLRDDETIRLSLLAALATILAIGAAFAASCASRRRRREPEESGG